MPSCETCGGDDFNCLDGKFFCSLCDTQSQNFVDDVVPELLADSTFSTARLRKRVDKTTFDCGRVWHSVEGFQQVIKGHIESLLLIGVNPAFDGVMKQIWFKYIQISGITVVDSLQKFGCLSDKRLSFRDYFLKNYSRDDAAISTKKLKLRYSKSSNQTNGQLDSENDWFSVDTEASSEEERSLSDSASRKRKFSRKRDPTSWSNLDIMSLPKIICFCYLSFRWMKELFTIGDLIHWAECGRIPYYTATDCFPPDMKLFSGDTKTFSHARQLKFLEVISVSNRLQRYIGMPPLPEVNIIALVGRYLHQLNLPYAFISLSKDIVTTINQARWPLRFCGRGSLLPMKIPDLIAASAIAIILKTIFVLNDEDEWSERKNPSVCCYHAELNKTCTPFGWKNWVQYYLQNKYNKKKTHFTLLESLNLKECDDVHACMEHYVNVILRGISLKTERAFKGRLETNEQSSELRNIPFKRLVDLQGSGDILEENREERTNGNGVLKILGRNIAGSNGDLTSCCVMSLTTGMQPNGVYIKFMDTGPVVLNAFSDSYAFILSLLAELTYASKEEIHRYINFAESAVIERCRKLQYSRPSKTMRSGSIHSTSSDSGSSDVDDSP